MRQRSREEKLAAYSQASKRGYQARKTFVKANGLKRKEPQTGGFEALDCQPGEADALRALGNAGSINAAQHTKEQHNHGLYTFETESQSLHR
jgi:hypothetical protein